MKDHLGDDWIGCMIKRCFGGETLSKAQFRARVESIDKGRGVNPPNWREELVATQAKLPKKASRSVYFVQSGGRDGPIKIGVTSNVKARVASLQTAHPEPLKVRLVVSGTQETERRFHRKFAALRMNGEWFRADPPLMRFIIAREGKG